MLRATCLSSVWSLVTFTHKLLSERHLCFLDVLDQPLVCMQHSNNVAMLLIVKDTTNTCSNTTRDHVDREGNHSTLKITSHISTQYNTIMYTKPHTNGIGAQTKLFPNTERSGTLQGAIGQGGLYRGESLYIRT